MKSPKITPPTYDELIASFPKPTLERWLQAGWRAWYRRQQARIAPPDAEAVSKRELTKRLKSLSDSDLMLLKKLASAKHLSKLSK